MADPDILITASELRSLLGGISDMTLWRWLADDQMNFPRPLVLRRRRYWRKSEVMAFQNRQAA